MQIAFLLYVTITGYSLIAIPQTAYQTAGTGAWLTIMMTAVLFAVGVFFIASLNRHFEGKSLYEYTTLLIGKPVAVILGIIYSLYFIFILLFLSRLVSDFINSTYLPITPLVVIIAIILITTGFIASKGITNVARLATLFGVVLAFVAVCVHILMFFFGDIRYIEPFFEKSQISNYFKGIGDLIVPFLGIEILTIIPFGSRNKKNGVLTAVLSLIAIGIFYVLVTETSVMIIGVEDINTYETSLVEALRQVTIPNVIILQRIDLLFITIGFAGIIGCLCIVYCCATEYVSKVFKKTNKKIIILLIGIACLFGGSLFKKGEDTDKIFASVVSIWGIAVAFFIPITLFIISKVRKI